MAKAKIQKFPLEQVEELLQNALASNAATVGHICITWNQLMLSLGNIFKLISGIEREVAEAIWHTPRNDATLRDLLLKVALIKFPEDAEKTRDSLKKLKWLIVTQFNAYRGHRDTAAHTPFTLGSFDGTLELVVNYHFGFDKSEIFKKLKHKDVEAYLSISLLNLRTLHEYAKSIELHLMMKRRGPWPETPAPRAFLPPQVNGKQNRKPRTVLR